MKLQFKIKGDAPLLVHSGVLADTLSPQAQAVKEISSKKNKTEDDLHELSRREWRGSLYTDQDDKPCIPTEVLDACIKSGAKVNRLGKQIEAGAFVLGETVPIEYNGPKSPDDMWEDGRFTHKSGVKVGQARVIRTRPIFRNWGLTFTVQSADDVIDKQQVVDAVTNAGRLKGLCDWRPKYGRFSVEEVEEVV